MPEHVYNFTRSKLEDGFYDVDHPCNQVGGQRVRLAKELEVHFPGRLFRICCEGTKLDVVFRDDPPLTGPEETALGLAIATHKGNSISMFLMHIKRSRAILINNRTDELIEADEFLFDSEVFLLDASMQRYYTSLQMISVLPAAIPKKDGQYALSIANLPLFLDAMFNAIHAHRASGMLLIEQVYAALTYADVMAVIDNR